MPVEYTSFRIRRDDGSCEIRIDEEQYKKWLAKAAFFIQMLNQDESTLNEFGQITPNTVLDKNNITIHASDQGWGGGGGEGELQHLINVVQPVLFFVKEVGIQIIVDLGARYFINFWKKAREKKINHATCIVQSDDAAGYPRNSNYEFPPYLSDVDFAEAFGSIPQNVLDLRKTNNLEWSTRRCLYDPLNKRWYIDETREL